MNGTDVTTSFPVELKKFLSGKAGSSLLLKGSPGSGKTTIALQILEQLQIQYNTIYLSTRVGDESLNIQFPWLKELKKNFKLLISSKLFLSEITKNIETEKPLKVYGKRLAEEFSKESPKKVPRIMFSELFQNTPAPEISKFYDEIEFKLPKRSIAVIDSIEGISTRYNVSEDRFVNMIIKDIVESVNASVIFISEKATLSPEDYIVDGTVYMDYNVEEGRRIRRMNINKLRGIETAQSSFVFTLNGGRIQTFYPQEYGNNPKDFKFTKNVGGIYSTGIADLDGYFDGGLLPGSIITLKIGPGLSFDDITLLIRPIMLNFLMNGIGIFIIPTGGWAYHQIEQDLSRFVSLETLKSRIRYVDYLASESRFENIIPANKDAISLNQMLMRALMELSGMENKPVLQIIGTDTIEYIKGSENAIKDLFNTSNVLKSSKDIGLFVVRENQKLKDEIINISDYYISMKEIENVPFIYGTKPRTIYNALIVDKARGFPNVDLVPLL